MILHTRRQFLARSPAALGALASLVAEGRAAEQAPLPRIKPRAKRIIYLFQSGAPSQLDLFDHKPGLKDRFAAELPDSIRMGQRLTGMTATQDSFPVAPSKYKFARHVKDDELFWPYEGEYWRDELRTYEYTLTKGCKVTR